MEFVAKSFLCSFNVVHDRKISERFDSEAKTLKKRASSSCNEILGMNIIDALSH